MSSSSEMLLERVRAATEDEYTIEGELGRGGMAAVFLARDISLERRVAIKVMLPDLVEMAGIQDRFVIEARTAAHLDHPGIVTVYSVKQRAGLLFIVMKYIEGRTLDSILKAEHKLDHGVVTEIVTSVAEALHFAHGEGVVHRDVKPANIIIDKRGRPVVTDFGIAKVTASRSITVTGSMLGTPAYMSPEQCRGLAATAASDQYSLGIMTYEMLAGRLPFQGTIFELINAHCNEVPEPLRDLVSGLDPALDETITRMLVKSPPERWPSLGDVAKRLVASRPHRRQTSEVHATIVALASGEKREDPTSRRTDVFADLSNAATALATTPAPGLVVTPAEPAIEIGQTVQMRVSQSSGASLAGVRIMWRSEDPTIATVDENGLVTGRSTGFAKITATGGASIGRASVTVKAASVDTLVVTPQSPELITENEIQFVATVLDSRGTTLLGQSIVWQSSDVGVCAVSGQGRAIGIAAGKATITAICGDVRATAQVRVRLPAVERVVVEPGEVSVETEETRRLTATVYGALDRKLPGRTLTWRSTVPAVAVVDGEGTVTGVSPGTAAIVATCDGKDGLVSVNVRSQPIVAVRIQPAQLQLETGRSLQLNGVGEDRRGRTVNEQGLEWQSDDDQVALVDASGKVHAVREGRTHVRASVGNVTSSIEVTVVPRPAVQIRIEPHRPTLVAGEFVTLDATVFDADGATLTGREVTWASSDAKVVEVKAGGVCEAKKPGGVRITAACERARTTTKLNVTAAVVAAPPAPAPADKRAGATDVIAAVKPRRRTGRIAVIGSALTIVVVAGIWFAVRGRGATALVPGAGAPGTEPLSTDTAAAVPTQRPAEVVTPPATTTTKAPAPATATNPGTPARGATNPLVKPPEVKPPVTTPNNPPPVTQPPPARGGAPPRPDSVAVKPTPIVTPPAGGTVKPTPVVTPPAGGGVTPPPVTPPPVTTAPAGRGAAAEAEATRALLCSNPATPASLLTAALGADPVGKLTALYIPRDGADTKAKESMLSALKDAQRPRAAARTVRNETAGESCDWVMVLDLNWSNAFGQPRKRSWQVRLQLEASGGAPRVKQIFGATDSK